MQKDIYVEEFLSTSHLSSHHGVIVPMVIPITPDGDLDEPAVRRIVDHMVAGGVHGVFVLGTTGENTSVLAAMRERLVAATVEHAAERARVYAGIGSNCLADSVAAARAYALLGVDAVVAHLPMYYVLNAEEQFAYFSALADRIDLPLVLYNIPPTTHMTISVELVEKLSRHPNVAGIKDSGGDVVHLAALLERLGDARPDFAVLVGASALSAHGLALGADGIVPAQGNLIPVLCRALFDRAVEGDQDGAEVYQQRLDAFAQLFVAGRSLAQSLGALKAMMGALGLCGPDVLPPLQPPSLEEQEALHRQFLAWREDQNAEGGLVIGSG
jgi:dihydrodipicolinate synthase/N-acetylneuraminate lyase